MGERMRAILIVLTMSLTVLAGCKESTYAPPPHRGPIEPSNPVPPTQETRVSADLDPSLAAETMKVVAERLLTPATLRDVGRVADMEFFRDVSLLHAAILQVARATPESPELLKVLRLYEKEALAPCRAKGSACAELKALAREARYSLVVMLVSRKVAPDQAWTDMGLAIDFNPVFPSEPEFSRFVIETTFDRIRALKKQPIAQAREVLLRAQRALNQVLLTSEHLNAVGAELIDKFDIWGENSPDMPIRSVVRQALWPVLLDRYAFANGQATAGFQKYIDRELNRTRVQVVDPLEKRGDWTRIRKSFSVPTLESNALVFVIDQVFRGEISDVDALGILVKMNAKAEPVIAAAEAYIRLRFVGLMLETQDRLAAHLKDPSKYWNMAQLRQQLEKSAEMETQWLLFQNRAGSVRSVVEGALGMDPSASAGTRSRVQSTFNKFDMNIKWFVSYPNMLPVLYNISKASLADRLQVLWWTFDLTSEMIISYWFDGGLGTWFNFSSVNRDNTRFSTGEILIAFRNAVLSGLFKAYDVKVTDFLLEIISRLLARPRAITEENVNRLKSQLLRDYESEITKERSYFSRAMRFCAGDPSVVEEFELKELTSYLAPFAKELHNGLTGRQQSKSDIYDFRFINRQFDNGGMYVALDQTRTDDFYYIEMIQKMVDMYKDYLREFGETDPGLAAVEAELAKISSQLREFRSLAFHIVRKYENCYYTQIDLTKEREMKVLAYERAYLAKAYAALKTVAADPSRLDEMNASLRRTYPEISFDTLDRIERKGNSVSFYYNKADFVLRVREYLLRGVEGATDRYPAIAPKMRIKAPANLLTDHGVFENYEYFFRNKDFYMETYAEGMTQSEFEGNLIRKAFFASSGLFSSANDPRYLGDMFTEWHGNLGRSMSGRQYRILTLATLAKLGKTEVYDYDRAGCAIDLPLEELEANCLTETEMTPSEVLKFQQEILRAYNIEGPFKEFMADVGSPSIAAEWAFQDLFVTRSENQPIGMLDGFRFAASLDSAGASVQSPGGTPPEKGGVDHRIGRLDRSESY